MKAQKYIVLLLAFILAFFSFAISYTALENLASSQDINPAPLFPLIIDGVIILVLVFRLYGDQKEMAQFIMAAYVCLSIGLNAVSHGNILGSIMASIAPISLLVASEISASMLHCKTGIKRDSRGRFVKEKVINNGN